MQMKVEEQRALTALEDRLRIVLPEQYQDCYEEVQPVSMGSAALKFDNQGTVAWDDMWDTFCDLAMAGGPPHKGTLLRPGKPADIEAQPDRYLQVVKEIVRGIAMISDLEAKMSATPGWLSVACDDRVMAEWLVRAIVMENISVHWEGATIYLPAGPDYRLEKEIKNVVTVVAKTGHYWMDHMWTLQQRKIANLFAAMARESPLIQPVFREEDVRREQHREGGAEIVRAIFKTTRLEASDQLYGDWVGIECPSINAAIWIMRGMVVSNVLARREGKTLFLPVNGTSDPDGVRVVQTFAQVYQFAQTRSVL